MTTEKVSRHWVMELNRYMIELVPTDDDQHYAGDECWCNPNRLTLKHYKKPSHNVRMWVHDSSTDTTLADLQAAIRGTLDYWDGIYRI